MEDFPSRPGAANPPETFAFDPDALRDAREVEREHYEFPDFRQFSDLAVSHPENTAETISEPELQRTFMDAVVDLHHLVEEYRFEALLAFTLLRDYRIKLDRGELEAPPSSPIDTMPLPAEVPVLLLGYMREPPGAAEVFGNPHQRITKSRVLSHWFAAQLIDSCLYRGIAACDRLAILLRCVARLPVERTRRGDTRQPSFVRPALDEMDASYEDIPGWQDLRDLTENPLFEFVKQERNGFTHERRRPSGLHGEQGVVYGFNRPGQQEQTVAAMDPETHYVQAPAFYGEVLKPAIDKARSVMLTKAGAEEQGRKTGPG